MDEKRDADPYQPIRQASLLIANFWLALCLAAERGDKYAIRNAQKQIRTLTDRTFLVIDDMLSPGAEK